MEDAHIAEANLYAIVTANASTPATGNASSSPSKAPKKQTIELPGHSFFGIFDGHGGTFAAQYTGDNLCRILSKQPMFVEYARFYQESMTKTFESPAEKIQFLRSGVDFLEAALKQAFVEIDCEIAMAIRGTPHPDANTPYQRPGTSNSASADHAANTMDAARKEAVHRARALDDDGDSGTTACCVLVTPDWLVCANAGDSRAVFSKKSRAVPLSYDHKPDDEGEERRIRAAGGYVAGGRVEGDLAVSRGLGDFRFKHMPTVLANIHLITGKPQREISEGQTLMKPGDQKVSPIPDIILQTRNREQDEFVIVACDGIWDVQTNQDCVTEVANMFQEGETNIGLLCEEVSRINAKHNHVATTEFNRILIVPFFVLFLQSFL